MAVVRALDLSLLSCLSDSVPIPRLLRGRSTAQCESLNRFLPFFFAFRMHIKRWRRGWGVREGFLIHHRMKSRGHYSIRGPSFSSSSTETLCDALKRCLLPHSLLRLAIEEKRGRERRDLTERCSASTTSASDEQLGRVISLPPFACQFHRRTWCIRSARLALEESFGACEIASETAPRRDCFLPKLAARPRAPAAVVGWKKEGSAAGFDLMAGRGGRIFVGRA